MKKFFTTKYIVGAIIVAAAVGGYFLIRAKKTVTYKETYTVAQQDVKQTVIATGSVTSQSDLSLSFKNPGVLAHLNVKVGDTVKAGAVLAELDQRDAQATIDQANAAVLSAKASYDKVANGASSTDIQVLQVALDNAKTAYANTVTQEQTLVANAHSALLNSGLAAVASDSLSTATVTVSGAYTGTAEGEFKINLYQGGDGLHYQVTGLGLANSPVNLGLPLSIGQGLYITISSTGVVSTSTTWTVAVPNTLSSTYVANYNAYQAALATQSQALSSAQGAVDTAQAALDQRKAAARPEDLAVVAAQVATAQAQLLAARNTYANNQIIAPISGTITAVDVKIGEQVTPQKEAIGLLDESSLHVESNIPESSIGLVQPGQSIDMTLDALGPDKHLTGSVLSIDPASTVASGVIQFRVVSSLPADETGIKPGMTVNISIIIADKGNVLAVPNRLINTNAVGQSTVDVLSNNQVVTTNITTGLVGDNFTEVLSGVSAGQTLVSVTK